MYGAKYSLRTAIAHSNGESKLDIPSGNLVAERGVALSYNLLPGQEVEVLTGLIGSNGLVTIRMYAIEASEAISLAVSSVAATPAVHDRPLGNVHFWTAAAGGNYASLKLRAPSSASGTVNVDLLLALD